MRGELPCRRGRAVAVDHLPMAIKERPPQIPNATPTKELPQGQMSPQKAKNKPSSTKPTAAVAEDGPSKAINSVPEVVVIDEVEPGVVQGPLEETSRTRPPPDPRDAKLRRHKADWSGEIDPYADLRSSGQKNIRATTCAQSYQVEIGGLQTDSRYRRLKDEVERICSRT